MYPLIFLKSCFFDRCFSLFILASKHSVIFSRVLWHSGYEKICIFHSIIGLPSKHTYVDEFMKTLSIIISLNFFQNYYIITCLPCIRYHCLFFCSYCRRSIQWLLLFLSEPEGLTLFCSCLNLPVICLYFILHFLYLFSNENIFC